MSRFPARKKALAVLAAVGALGAVSAVGVTAATSGGSGGKARTATGSRPSSPASGVTGTSGSSGASSSSTDGSSGSQGGSGQRGDSTDPSGSTSGPNTGSTSAGGSTGPSSTGSDNPGPNSPSSASGSTGSSSSPNTNANVPIPTAPGYRPPVTPRKNADVDCSVAKCIALTFDDGPGPDTGRLLDILHRENVPATFFVLGDQAEKYPATVRREYAEGHEVGNHTFDHKDLSTLSAAAIQDEIKRGADAIAATGVPRPTLLRPPYGAVNDTVRTYAGFPFVMWRVDPLDWKYPNAARVTDQIVGHAGPGRIVLSHDIHPTTVDAMPAVIEQLKQQGYTFVTVSTLLKGVDLRNGQSYFTRPAAMTGSGGAQGQTQSPQYSQYPPKQQNSQPPQRTPSSGSGGGTTGSAGTSTQPSPSGGQYSGSTGGK